MTIQGWDIYSTDNFEHIVRAMQQAHLEIDSLKKNLEFQKNALVDVTQRYERYDLALKFATALAQSNHLDPIVGGFELADQYMEEIKSREKMQ